MEYMRQVTVAEAVEEVAYESRHDLLSLGHSELLRLCEVLRLLVDSFSDQLVPLLVVLELRLLA